MSNAPPPPDPYRSPAYFADQDVADAVMVPRRPGGLTAICVIAIILGVLGVITGLMGIVGAVAGQAMQNAMAPSMPQNLRNDEDWNDEDWNDEDWNDEDMERMQREMERVQQELEKVQQEMNEAMQEVGQRFIVPNVVFISIALLLATGLIVGGAKSLKLKPTGRWLLLTVFVIAIFFELVRGGFQLYVQMQIMVVVAEFWPRLMETAGAKQAQGGPDMQTIMDIALTAAKVMAYTVTIVPVLVKGGFYAVGSFYLGRQKVKQLFKQSVAEQMPYGSAKPTI